MTILFVCSGNSRFGIVPFVKFQGESIAKLGHTVKYFTVKGKGVFGYLKNILRLRSASKECDLVHAHYGLIGFLCAISFLGKPVFLSIMGDDAYGSYNIKGRKTLSSIFIIFLTKIAVISAQQIIVKSLNIYHCIPNKKNATIIPNGVDLELFKPADRNVVKNILKLETNKKLVLFLSDPHDPRKNYHLFKEAQKLLIDLNIDFIAPYPVEPSEIVLYLNACDVLVLTSFNEGSPNIIKEAMACNIPIVSTDVGDVREVIKNTEGCYITTFDSDDVAEKIKKALAFGKRTTGRQDIKHLESSVVADRIINIYNKIIA